MPSESKPVAFPKPGGPRPRFPKFPSTLACETVPASLLSAWPLNSGSRLSSNCLSCSLLGPIPRIVPRTDCSVRRPPVATLPVSFRRLNLAPTPFWASRPGSLVLSRVLARASSAHLHRERGTWCRLLGAGQQQPGHDGVAQLEYHGERCPSFPAADSPSSANGTRPTKIAAHKLPFSRLFAIDYPATTADAIAGGTQRLVLTVSRGSAVYFAYSGVVGLDSEETRENRPGGSETTWQLSSASLWSGLRMRLRQTNFPLTCVLSPSWRRLT